MAPGMDALMGWTCCVHINDCIELVLNWSWGGLNRAPKEWASRLLRYNLGHTSQVVNTLIAVLATGPSDTVHRTVDLGPHRCSDTCRDIPVKQEARGLLRPKEPPQSTTSNMLPEVTILSCYGWNKGLKQDWREVLILAWHQGLSNITKTGTSVNPCNSLLDLLHCLLPPVNTLFDSAGLKKFRDFRNREKKMVLSTEGERMSCIFLVHVRSQENDFHYIITNVGY